jgi:polysaccharide export outer membrane protein
LVGLLLVGLCVGSLAQQRIAVGDKLNVVVSDSKELTGEYVVSTDGTILMPFIGAVEVLGLTTDAAAAKIRKILADQRVLLDPRVSVILSGEPPKVASVTGAVQKPGDYPVTTTSTLEDLLQQAQPTPNADLAAVRLTLPDGTVQVVDYRAFQAAGRTEGNPVVPAGSKVYVAIRPAVQEVTVLGAVLKPGIVKHTESMTLADALKAAGGTKADADLTRIKVQKADGRTLEINLTQVGGNAPITPGDQVFVPMLAASSYVMVRGAVGNPGLVPYKEKMTVTEALYGAGKPLESARLDRVEVKRIESGREQTIKVNVASVLRGQASDVELKAGDTVIVPFPPKAISVGEAINYAWILLSLILILRKL